MRSTTVLFLVLFLTASVTSAEIFTVTRFDEAPGEGCDAVSCSLRSAVIAANDLDGPDVIQLTAGVYILDFDGAGSDPETGDLNISDDVTIRGAGGIIDRQSLGRIMDIANADVTLENLTLRGANTSLATNGSLNGGAVLIGGGSLTLRSVNFEGNEAQTLGGAIRASNVSAIDIEGGTFTNNSAGDGAAISSDSGVTIRGTVFSGNTADKSISGNGGALNLTGSTQVSHLRGVTMTDNSGTGSGGTIWFTAKDLFIHDSVFVDNASTGSSTNGGLILFSGTGHPKRLEIVGSTFDGNSAPNGGVLSFGDVDDTLRIRNSTFVDNQATADGGALRLTGGDLRVTNSTFSGNQAASDGGAILLNNAELLLEHVTFSGNQAPQGEAIRVFGSAPSSLARFVNSLIDNNCEATNADTLASDGGNVEGPGDTCGLNQATDITGRDMTQLGVLPLADNGGDNATHQLTVGSVARDNGEPDVCAAVHIDQRYGIRDMDCDSGAVEADAIADDLIFADGLEPAD